MYRNQALISCLLWGVKRMSEILTRKYSAFPARPLIIRNERCEIRCNVMIDGYTDFIFVNRFGEAQHQGTNADVTKELRKSEF